MPYSIDWKDNNVIITFNGTLRLKDVLDVNNTLYGDARFDDMNFQITDFRLVEEIDVDEIDVSVIASLDKASSNWNPNMKLANITSNEFGKEMIKKYSGILDGTGWQVETFDDMEDAVKWCNES